MKKYIKISYPDGSLHSTIVTQADVTRGGTIVISYYDISDSMHASFTELIQKDGQYYKNPEHQDWSYYVSRFKPFDRELSDSIVSSLPEKLGIYDKTVAGPQLPQNSSSNKNENNENEYYQYNENEPEKEEVPAGISYYITAVMYANQGDSFVSYDEPGLLPVFLSERKMSDSGPLKEEYKKIDIEDNDLRELLYEFETRFGSNFDVSTIPADCKFELSSGNKYYVTFASCDEDQIFQGVRACSKVSADISIIRPDESSYPDNLSAALHHDLPLEITVKDRTIRYEQYSNYGRKKVM